MYEPLPENGPIAQKSNSSNSLICLPASGRPPIAKSENDHYNFIQNLILFFLVNCTLLTVNCFAQPTQQWVARWGQSYPYGAGGSAIKTDNLGFIYVLADTGNGFGFLKYDQNGNLLFSTTYWPGGYNSGYGIHFDVTPVGDVYVTGDVTSGNYNEWVYIVKFNTYGVLQWGRLYDNDITDVAQCIRADYQGNVVIAGGSFTGNTNFGLIIKYNSSGDTLWTRHFNNGQGYAYINNFVLDSTNEIYIAADIGTGSYGNPNKSLIMKYNSTGNLLWFSTFNIDTSWSSYGRGINRDNYGNIYVVGLQGISDYGYTYLLKLDNNGDTLWSRLYPGYTPSYSPYGPVLSLGGSEIYYTGTYRPANNNYIAIFKYDSSGTFQWIQTYYGGVPGTDANNQPASIKMDRYNNIYVCGSAEYPSSGNNFVTLKYLPTGTLQWIAAYTGRTTNADDHANDLLLDTGLDVYVTGGSERQNSPYDDAVTIKYSQPLGLKHNSTQIPASYRLYQNYPNPFNPRTIITYEVPKLSDIRLVIYSILGEAVKTIASGKQQASTYTVALDMSEFASGVYFCRLFANGNVIDTKKLVLIK